MLRLPVGILIGLFNNKAVVESRFRPQCAAYTEYLLVFVVEQNLVGMMQLTCSSCPLASYKKWPHCVKKWSRPQNRKHIRYIATPSGEGQATATVDMHKNLDSRVVPEISLHTNRQTHMHAHCNTSHPLPGGNETWHSTKHEECDLKFSNKPYCTARVLLARINSLTTTGCLSVSRIREHILLIKVHLVAQIRGIDPYGMGDMSPNIYVGGHP